MIDLHVHTTCSDGSYSPREVIGRALSRGLCAMAVTDHDNVSGIMPAIEAAEGSGLEVIAGVELSAESPHGILHILGYFFDPNDAKLADGLTTLRAGRRARIPQILEKLSRLNLDIPPDEIDREAAGGTPGRPHVAAAMMYRGYVRTTQEAFEKYLRRGAPAYVPKLKFSPEKAIKLITDAGGVAVIAHPYSLEARDSDALFARVAELKDAGICGIEAYYPTHSKEQTAVFLRIAEALDLIVTAGTDFHGRAKPGIELGCMLNGKPAPYSIVEGLKQAAQRARI